MNPLKIITDKRSREDFRMKRGTLKIWIRPIEEIEVCETYHLLEFGDLNAPRSISTNTGGSEIYAHRGRNG